MTKRAVLLEALASTPADVARLVRGLDETAAVQQMDGGWSCYDVVAHLADTEPLYRADLQRVLAEDTPAVAGSPPHEMALARARSLAALTDCFSEARRVTIDWLREISPAAWQRPAIHQTHGRTTLRFLVHDLVAHDIEHTGQLALIVTQLRAERRRAAAEAPGGGP